MADVSGIAGIGAFVELASIPGIHKQAHCRPQSIHRTREAPRRPPQPREIVAQFGVAAFHRVGLTFVGHSAMCSSIHPRRVEIEGVTEVLPRPDTPILLALLIKYLLLYKYKK
jgi:hypothetical protein